MPALVERRAQARGAAVHHVAGTDAVGAGVGDAQRHLAEGVERRGEIDLSIRPADRAVAVARARAQADIDPQVDAIAECAA